MMRILFPIILIAIAGAIYFAFTDPLINGPLLAANPKDPSIIDGGILALRVEKASLNEALKHARELGKEIDRLRNTYNNLPPDQIKRLDDLLPDTVDNVQLIIDINNIAKSHGMEIKNINIKTEEDRTQTSVISRPGSMEQGSVALSFSVTGSYDVFQSFLIDMARSLRVVDIISIGVASTNTPGNYQYSIEIKTYWLK
jgi:Tfp pilus assembly protein PilO